MVGYAPAGTGVTRWRVLEWLLGASQDQQLQSDIKQAAIFDCLFYGKAESVAKVEPVMSWISHSLRNNPGRSHELLEFILLSCKLYDKQFVRSVSNSVKESFYAAAEAGFILSIDQLVIDPRLESSVRNGLGELLSSASTSYSECDSVSSVSFVMDVLGEEGKRFVEEPNLETLLGILEEHGISEKLVRFVLNTLEGPFACRLEIDTPKGVLADIFAAVGGNAELWELSKGLCRYSPEFAVRLLVYSLAKNLTLYFALENNLERDLACRTFRESPEVHYFVFEGIFTLHSELVTCGVIELLVKNSESEVVVKVQIDLGLRKYDLITGRVHAVLVLSEKLPSTERFYIWKFIAAELGIESLTVILDFFKKPTERVSYEFLSEVVGFVRKNAGKLGIEHVKRLLGLDVMYSQAVSVMLVFAGSHWVEQGVVQALSLGERFLQSNVLKHMKKWLLSEDNALVNVIQKDLIQEKIAEVLAGYTSDHYKEFNCLLDNKRTLYTL